MERLIGQINSARSRAAAEDAALVHDRALFPVATHNYRGELRWEGSAAEAWLRVDVSTGKSERVKPKALHNSRAAYRVFPLKVFREHIYQERRCQKYYTWRNESGKPKATEWC